MARKPETFAPRTEASLRAWLRDTTVGRNMLKRACDEVLEEKCRQCQSPHRPRPKVLAVLRRIGRFAGVEVYAEKGVSVKVKELIDIPDEMLSGEVATLFEELLEAGLPESWRRILWRHPTQEVFRGITAERRLAAMVDLDLLGLIQEEGIDR